MKCSETRKGGLTQLLQIEIYNNRAGAKRSYLCGLLAVVLLLAGCQPITEEELSPEPTPLPLPPPTTVAEEEQVVLPPGILMLEADGMVNEIGEGDESNGGEAKGMQQGAVRINKARVNIRVGPSTDFDVVANAVEGDTFTTTGRTEDGWWRICCVSGPDDSAGEATRSAWLSGIVVEPDEVAEALPVAGLMFPDDLTAVWDIQYECGSRRCAVSACAAVSRTEVLDNSDPRWLEINRIVTWEGACGEDSTWPHQIDRLEGTERYPNSTGLFFFNYWAGPRPGEANALFLLDTGEEIEAWCSDEQEAEVLEDSGWTTVYNGLTCHDVRSGMLVSMQYTKRWFFTGEYEGDRYERAYFGDFEIYRVKLERTNVLLGVINARAAE